LNKLGTDTFQELTPFFLVRASEQKVIIKLTDVYKRFSQQRRHLTVLEHQIQDGLDNYEKALINETRKPLGLLPRKLLLSVKNQSPLQTDQVRPS